MNVKSRPSIAPSLPTVTSAKEDEEETTGNEEIQEGKDQKDVGDITNEKGMIVEENNKQITTSKCIKHRDR